MSYIGTNKLGTMYLGDTKIGKAYLGSDLVYSSGPSLPYTPLTWVGSDEGTTNYKVFINLTFTKNTTFNYDFLPRNASWWDAFKISRPNALWSNDKQMFCLERNNNTNNYVILYFNSTSYLGETNFTSVHHIVVDGTGIKNKGGSYGKTFSTKSDAPSDSEWFINFTKFYSFTAYESGVLVADIIPVLYEGSYGLWDKVTNVFITPVSGTMTGG